MKPTEDIPQLLHQTAIWWATYWDSPNSSSPQMAELQQGGDTRLDELLATYGLEIEDAIAEQAWKRFEVALSVLNSELRFRVFTSRHDALHASVNVALIALETAGYRILPKSSWKAFQTEYATTLQKPVAYDANLRTCIRRHFQRPPKRRS